ncbi:MAG: hypothetical protein ACLU5J_03000 [Christensenellales bacterium]
MKIVRIVKVRLKNNRRSNEKESICKEGLAEQDLRKESYIGDSNYLTKQQEEVEGYNLIMPEAYHKAVYQFTYEENYTSIKIKQESFIDII